MFRHTYAEVNLDHLEHNIKSLQKMVGDSFFCPMVKANAYGHGAVEVSKKMESLNVKALGVALIEEAIELRRNGVNVELFHFGPFKPGQAQLFFEYKITPVITSLEELDSLIQLKQKISVHIKVDVEMNRLGLKGDQFTSAIKKIKKSLVQLEGVCTHFAIGEDLANSRSSTSASFKNFLKLIKEHKLQDLSLHCLNGDGLLSLKARNEDIGARPGLAAYGVGALAKRHGLKPVMSFISEVVLAKKVYKGESVSYGKTWVAQKETHIAIISAGYADGYPWGLSNSGSVVINGKTAKIIGRVCMDYIIVELSSIEASVGDKVLLWGQLKDDEISVQDIADLAGTIPYEILVRLSQRVPRKYN